MAKKQTEFQQFLEREVSKYKGVYVPVNAGMLRRLLVKKLPLNKMHPNPDDEFCFPNIGPNYQIISDYEKEMRQFLNDRQGARIYGQKGAYQPLYVEKIRPDGYMILNGHHRWAAARKAGVSSLPVRIVDLTQKSDIQKMLASSNHDRRVTLDLDEVVFCTEDSQEAEKALSFPYDRLYPQRVRLGIPALFYYLNQNGYDIWVYTAQYYSADQIMRLFRHYHVRVTGAVTGTARKGPHNAEIKDTIEKLMSSKYNSTIHIDRESVLHIKKASGEVEEYPIPADSAWSTQVIDIIGKTAGTK